MGQTVQGRFGVVSSSGSGSGPTVQPELSVVLKQNRLQELGHIPSPFLTFSAQKDAGARGGSATGTAAPQERLLI